MLDHLRGSVRHVGADGAVLSVGGVGVRVEMPTADLARLEGEVSVQTVLLIRDDELHLYGFLTTRGRELFRALLKVGGVGPKAALAVLSFHPVESLERLIAAGDADAIRLVPGIGKKTAERIVLELKDRLGAADVAQAASSSPVVEVREALKGLGYTASEVQDVLSTLPPDGDAPTLLRHALKALGGREPAGVDL